MVDIGKPRLMAWVAGAPIVALIMGAGACSPQPRVSAMKVNRDAGCLCCHAWAELMKQSGRFQVTLTEGEDLQALKQRLGVPPGLGACHTAEVDGYVIEGHVPAGDILKLLTERPAGLRGIAVPGMPRGSPGMEQPNGVVDAYTVVAFDGAGAQRDFSHHAGNL